MSENTKNKPIEKVEEENTKTVQQKSNTKGRKDGNNKENRSLNKLRSFDKGSEENQYSDVLLGVNRVTKVVEGGRIFSFSACVIVGNRAGCIGFGKGKANELPDAQSKGVAKAKKNVIKVPLYKGRTVYHDVIGYGGASKILLRRASAGRGIIAGPTVRSILSMCGIKDIVVKSYGSNNMYNIVRAVFDALSQLSTPNYISKKRGKDISSISTVEIKKETML